MVIPDLNPRCKKKQLLLRVAAVNRFLIATNAANSIERVNILPSNDEFIDLYFGNSDDENEFEGFGVDDINENLEAVSEIDFDQSLKDIEIADRFIDERSHFFFTFLITLQFFVVVYNFYKERSFISSAIVT
jgi:hypothetical protein